MGVTKFNQELDCLAILKNIRLLKTLLKLNMNYNQTLINEFIGDNLLVEKEPKSLRNLSNRALAKKIDENRFLPKETDSFTTICKHYDFIDTIVFHHDLEMFEKLKKFETQQPQVPHNRILGINRLMIREENKIGADLD